ncbi:cytochrome c oxidase subunit 2-like [Rutidosis leptorrhynchoides]|uniref:cytochrome c oxidase subunit 2-like n=1 Tax=Rutidosis leptorrhynchoides TaxID=125765 RepID=UPI003A9A2B5F
MIVLEWLFLTIAPCDAAEPWQLGSQDAATPMMQGIIDLHHDIFFFLILILVFVSRILVRALWHFRKEKNPIPQRIVHGTTIEILWTIFPSIILMFIAIPSFALLYSMDEVVVNPAITIKAIGHQWYWTYEYSDYNSSDEQSLTFDSYMIPEDDLELGQLRLLEVDNRVVVPAKSHLRIIVASADVLHSWAVPTRPAIAWCDAGNPSPPSPPGRLPLPQPETPPVPDPVPVVIPRLPQPLLSDEERSAILYQRYLGNNLGGSDNLLRLVSTIDAQLLVERYVEAALVDDGFHPQAVLNGYRDIRGSLHYPQGRLLSVRTYESYVTQIRELGTRGSVPYRRVLRAIHRDLLLPRRIGNRWV